MFVDAIDDWFGFINHKMLLQAALFYQLAFAQITTTGSSIDSSISTFPYDSTGSDTNNGDLGGPKTDESGDPTFAPTGQTTSKTYDSPSDLIRLFETIDSSLKTSSSYQSCQGIAPFTLDCLAYVVQFCIPPSQSCKIIQRNATLYPEFSSSSMFGNIFRRMQKQTQSESFLAMIQGIVASLPANPIKPAFGIEPWQQIFDKNARFYFVMHFIYRMVKVQKKPMEIVEWAYASMTPLKDLKFTFQNITNYLSMTQRLFTQSGVTLIGSIMTTTKQKRLVLAIQDYASLYTQATSLCNILSTSSDLSACLGFASTLLSSDYYKTHLEEVHSIYKAIFVNTRYEALFLHCAKWLKTPPTFTFANTMETCQKYHQENLSWDLFSQALVLYIFPNGAFFPQY